MIGTANEMLFYHTFRADAQEKLGFSARQMARIRSRIGTKELGEKTLFEYLTRLGCRKIRDAFFIPAVFADEYGKMYDERALVARAERAGVQIDGVNLSALRNATAARREANWYDIYKLYRHFRMSVLSKRTSLPSVWVYEDIPCADWNDEVMSAKAGRLVRFD